MSQRSVEEDEFPTGEDDDESLALVEALVEYHRNMSRHVCKHHSEQPHHTRVKETPIAANQRTSPTPHVQSILQKLRELQNVHLKPVIKRTKAKQWYSLNETQRYGGAYKEGGRLCWFPVIACMVADYEEQVLIAVVKSQRQCTVCTVPPDDGENLLKTWEPRTHVRRK